jgi:tetratricopeptide (TPR) repeat protein
MEIGRFSDALVHVRYLQKSGRGDATLHLQAGQCLELLAEYTDALTAYEAALKRDPNLIVAYERLAWLCQSRLDRPELAQATLDALVERFPNGSNAWVIRGRFRAEFGSLIAAQADIDRALTLDPHGVETQLAAARLAFHRATAARANGHDAEARQIADESRQQLRRVLGEHPEQVELRLRFLQLEIRFGSPTEAQQQINELLALSPRDERAQLLLVEMNLEQSRFEAAQTAIDKLPRTPGSDALRRFAEGRKQMSQSAWREAVATLDETRRISTQASGLLERTELALAQCHAALGDAEAETAAFRRALKSNPASIPARLGLAACLLREQKSNEAIAEFRSLAHLPQARTPLVRLLIARNLQMPELARD